MLFWRRRHPVDDATLNAYVDGQLGEAERARVVAHIETCAACAGALDELRALGEALGALPREGAPRSFALRESDVRPRAAPRWEGALRRWQPALSGVAVTAFAAFFLLVGVDVLDVSSSTSDELSGGPAMAPQESSDGGALSEEPGAPSGTAADDAATGQYGPGATLDGRLPSAGPTSLPPDRTKSAGPSAEADEATPGASGFIAQPGRTPEEPTATATPSPAAGTGQTDDGDSNLGLRVGEAVAAAIALGAGGSLAFVWWRRRTG